MFSKVFFIFCVLFWSSTSLNGQYNTYDDDCLDFYADEVKPMLLSESPPNRSEHQIIPFCRRDHFGEEPFKIDQDIPKLTFNDLYQRNITAAQLYSWSAHLEMVEEYEAFRQNPINNKIIGQSTVFYNCSSKHKFGPYCQYSFNSQVRVLN